MKYFLASKEAAVRLQSHQTVLLEVTLDVTSVLRLRGVEGAVRRIRCAKQPSPTQDKMNTIALIGLFVNESVFVTS
jgi:hypothetical protein